MDWETNETVCGLAPDGLKLASLAESEFDDALAWIACELRKKTYRILEASQSGHLGGPLSSVELLVVLYFGGDLHYDPTEPDHENRDRVVLRGHLGPIRYPILAMSGFFPESRLLTYRRFKSQLPGHEDFRMVPGVDITPSGSLGMVLSYGVGAARVGKIERRPFNVFVFLGDGEEQEGNVSEAARNAVGLELDNLVCIIDKNEKQLTGRTRDVDRVGSLARIWKGYGWYVIELEDGHDIAQIRKAYDGALDRDGPTVIIAHTTKGKGVPGIENHRTGMHSGREKSKSLTWDDLVQIQENEQRKYGECCHRDFVRRAQTLARPEARDPRPATSAVNHPELEIRPGPEKYDNMVKSLEDYFSQLADSQPLFKVYSLAADFLPAFRVKRRTLRRLGDYVDVGLKEQHMVAMAHGISVTDPNARSLVFIGDEFLYRSADQMNACAQGRSNVIFLTCDAGICGAYNGPTHQSSGQPGMIAMMPRITTLEPADIDDLYDCLNWALGQPRGPVYIRTHIVPVPEWKRPSSGHDTIRGYSVVRNPSDGKKPDLIVVASGFLVGTAVETTRRAAARGPRLKVISVTDLKSLDDGFVRLLENDIPVLTVYNGNPAILQSSVAKAVMEHSDVAKTPSVIRGHGFEYGMTGSLPDLLDHFGFTPDGLLRVIERLTQPPSAKTHFPGNRENTPAQSHGVDKRPK